MSGLPPGSASCHSCCSLQRLCQLLMSRNTQKVATTTRSSSYAINSYKVCKQVYWVQFLGWCLRAHLTLWRNRGSVCETRLYWVNRVSYIHIFKHIHAKGTVKHKTGSTTPEPSLAPRRHALHARTFQLINTFLINAYNFVSSLRTNVAKYVYRSFVYSQTFKTMQWFTIRIQDLCLNSVFTVVIPIASQE